MAPIGNNDVNNYYFHDINNYVVIFLQYYEASVSHWLQDSHKSGNLRYLSTRKKYHASTGCVMTTVTQSIHSGISWIREHNNFYHLMYFFRPFHWPRAHHMICLSTNNNVLLQIIFCS